MDGVRVGNAGVPLATARRPPLRVRRPRRNAAASTPRARAHRLRAGLLVVHLSTGMSSGIARARDESESESVGRLLDCRYQTISKRLGDSRSGGGRVVRLAGGRRLLLGEGDRLACRALTSAFVALRSSGVCDEGQVLRRRSDGPGAAFRSWKHSSARCSPVQERRGGFWIPVQWRAQVYTRSIRWLLMPADVRGGISPAIRRCVVATSSAGVN